MDNVCDDVSGDGDFALVAFTFVVEGFAASVLTAFAGFTVFADSTAFAGSTEP